MGVEEINRQLSPSGGLRKDLPVRVLMLYCFSWKPSKQIMVI
jgi:hypothetical protein